MAVNYRWGMKSNINRVIDDYRIDQNPMYGISRRDIGGSYTTKFLPDFAYADKNGGYAASTTAANLYRLDSQLTRWTGVTGLNQTTGHSARYDTTFTFENGIRYSVLCIGGGGGAASTGSNRGGGGGAGGGLMYLTFTASSTFTGYIFVGAPGVTISSTNTSAGGRGGNSFISITSSGIQGAICGAGGGMGGYAGPSSGTGSPARGGLGGQTFGTNWSGRVSLTSYTTSPDGDGGYGGESAYNNAGGAGGGAGGYSGRGGDGAYGNGNTGANGGSGGGGGGGGTNSSNCGGGGGVGVFGQGSSGPAGGAGAGGSGGSGGTNGTVGNNASDGGEYGGGGGADDDDFNSGTSYNGTGGRGCVVITTGYGNYPSSLTLTSPNLNIIDIPSNRIASWESSAAWIVP